MNGLKPTVLGNLSKEEKEKIIEKRLKEGWMCFVNKRTGVRHVWMPPTSNKVKKIQLRNQILEIGCA